METLCLTSKFCSNILQLIGCLVLMTLNGGVALAEDTIALTTLDLSTVAQGFGKPQIDKSVDGHPMMLGGRKFAHGLGTHSPGDFLIDLDGKTTRFTAWVGIDDETNKWAARSFRWSAMADCFSAAAFCAAGRSPNI